MNVRDTNIHLEQKSNPLGDFGDCLVEIAETLRGVVETSVRMRMILELSDIDTTPYKRERIALERMRLQVHSELLTLDRLIVCRQPVSKKETP